ncbi:MAG: hypothetical protein K5648_05650 [Erysipelotrichaceae bacterium]|nr:hypothetical protein [Erysipelotrichaceae bacterium]
MEKKEDLISTFQKQSKRAETICLFLMILLIITLCLVTWIFLSGILENYKTILDIFARRASDDFSSFSPLQKTVYLYLGEDGLFWLSILRFSLVIIIDILIFSKTRKIFKQLRESASPFDEMIVEALKRVLILVVVSAALRDPLTAIVLAIFGSCLFKIYEYGCFLQKESDDTV